MQVTARQGAATGRGVVEKRQWPGFSAITGITGRLSMEMSRIQQPGALSDMRILLVGFEPLSLQRLREAARSLKVGLAASSPNVRHLPDVADMDGAFNVLIVNADAFADTEEAVDALIAFRRHVQAMSVIIVSSNVNRDDLGTERKAICDATLQYPVSADRLRQALIAARDNSAPDRIG